jgi:hypothetical protein
MISRVVKYFDIFYLKTCDVVKMNFNIYFEINCYDINATNNLLFVKK